jgi:hypothetical protein
MPIAQAMVPLARWCCHQKCGRLNIQTHNKRGGVLKGKSQSGLFNKLCTILYLNSIEFLFFVEGILQYIMK